MMVKKETVPIDSQKKRVLVVDDDKSVLRSTALILEKNGFKVDTAETGKEALEKFSAHCYDVILMDLKLPDMDGIEVLSKANSPDSVKIMLTGYHSIVSAIEATEQGVDAYLRKPVRPEELI
jgi:DNA-binding response OmpR family regulator